MSIPFPTTQIVLLSPGADDTPAEDWGGSPDVATGYAPVGAPILAHLSSPSGYAYASPEGSAAGINYRLVCDPCPIEPNMRVRDLFDNTEYDVVWARNRPGPFPYVVAGLMEVTSSH